MKEGSFFKMRHFTATCAVSALIAAGFAQTAAADITAEEAWGSLRDLLTGSGYEGTASETREGDTLVVGDAVFTMPATAAQGSTSIDFGTLRFTETGDGSVAVEMPDVMPITSGFTDPDTGIAMSVVVEVTQSGADLVLSGTPERITQTYTAQAVDVALASIDAPDDALPPDAIRMTMQLAGLSSTNTIEQGDPRPMAGTASAETASFDMAFAVPGEGSGAASGEIRGISFEGTATMPMDTSAGDLHTLMQAGYGFDGTFSHQGASMTLTGEEEGSTFQADTGAASGTFDMAMSGESLSYTASQTAVTIAAMLSDLPFPLSIQAQALDAGVTLPVAKSDEAEEFSLLVNLQDFEMSDMVWALLDPQSVLPRDPAKLLVDLSGKAKVFFNLLDPQSTEALAASGDAPGELEALDINAVDLKLAGAELNGSGAFTFDNTDLATFGGFPKPTGALELHLAGGNALLEKLAQMGMIGPQEAGVARMMMGMLAVPGDAPDTLNSKLEINAEGHILANGQRIQ